MKTGKAFLLCKALRKIVSYPNSKQGQINVLSMGSGTAYILLVEQHGRYSVLAYNVHQKIIDQCPKVLTTVKINLMWLNEHNIFDVLIFLMFFSMILQSYFLIILYSRLIKCLFPDTLF